MFTIYAAITPGDAPGLVFKVLAVLGGALVFGLLTGFLFRLATRLLTTKPLPVWAVRGFRLVGGVLGGWLVALWVFGGGGAGVGGSGGFGFGGGGKGGDAPRDAKKDKDEEKPPKKDGDRGPGVGDIVRVAVLGLDPLRAIQGEASVDINQCYRIEGEDPKRVLSLEGVKQELEARRQKIKDLKVFVVIYSDSPGKQNVYVHDLERWLSNQKLFKDFDAPAQSAPQ